MSTREMKSLLVRAARTPRWLAERSGYSLGTIYGVLSLKADHPSKNDKTFAKLRAILKEEIERDCDPLAVSNDATITVASDMTREEATQKINKAAE